MRYAPRIVLHSLSGDHKRIDSLVEDFLRDGVKYVAVVGRDAAHVEDLVDEVVVGDGSDGSRFLLTSSHASETLEEVVELARMLSSDLGEGVQVVEV